MKKLIEQARLCMPKLEKGLYHFCTGWKAAPATFFSFKNLEQCIAEIKKNGFKVLTKEDEQILPKDLYQSFMESTKQAETFSSYNVVAIKENLPVAVCSHELIHVFQQKATGDSLLLPKNRHSETKEFEKILLKAADEIAIVEVKDKKKAFEQTQEVQLYISIIKEWTALDNWLDEKEVYIFLAEQCGNFCSKDDRNIILANLYMKYQAYLPVEYHKKIVQELAAMERDKEITYAKEAKKVWVGMNEKGQEKLRELLKLDWAGLLKNLSPMKVVKVTNKITNPQMKIHAVPEKLWDEITDYPESLKGRIAAGKLESGMALGKTICSEDDYYLVMTPMTTKGTVVHEYGHYLQSLKNKDYCPAITDQPQILNDFNKGVITRNEYEKKILFFKAINTLAEHEIYGIMLTHKDKQSAWENLNNQLMFKQYTPLE